jgi:LysM repeat protein
VPPLFVVLALLAAPLPHVAAQTTTHTVQPGETLSQIAQQYGATEAELLALNDLDEPDTIIVGQQLVVPTLATFAPAAPGQHRVQAGETLSEIAKQYGITLEQLMAVNDIADPDSVYSGQLLEIAVPAPATAALATAAIVATATPSSDLPDVYTVAAGDTLSAIARRFDIDIDVLRSLNALGDADNILVGQNLRLVVAPTATTVSAPDATKDAGSKIDIATVGPTRQPTSTIEARLNAAAIQLAA